MAKQVIEQMYAFVSEDETGEGVVAHFLPGTGWMPLVGADMARVEQIRPVAQELANADGKAIKLVVFEKRTVVETIEPYAAGGMKGVITDKLNPLEEQ